MAADQELERAPGIRPAAQGNRPMFDYWLSAFVTLFVTIDPIGLAPIFVIVTAGMAAAERRQTAIRATAVAAAILIAFALFGGRLLEVLGISLSAFRIAGGILLFWTAFEMVFEKRPQRRSSTAEQANAEDLNHIAVVPLAIPLISGPGSISATILLASRAEDMVALVGLIAIIVGLIGACLAIFLAAGPLDRFLGTTGRAVTSRLLGVILAAFAVQFVADGITAILAAA